MLCMAVLSSEAPIEIMVRSGCSHEPGDIAGDNPYGSLYVSRQPLMKKSMVQLASRWIDAALERRLVTYYFRQMESELQDLITN